MSKPYMPSFLRKMRDLVSRIVCKACESRVFVDESKTGEEGDLFLKKS